MAAKIDLLPAAPTRADPANFPARADAFVTALALFVAQANALSQAANDNAAAAQASATSAANAPGTAGTSTTSLTVGSGQQYLAIQGGKAFVPGQFMVLARTADPATWMVGQAVSYNSASGALVVNVTLTNGAGTFTDWTVSIGPPVFFAAANAAQILAGLSGAVAVTPAALLAAAAPLAIAYTATIAIDLSSAVNFTIPLAGSLTLANPTNAQPGQSGIIRLVQDATGNRAVALGSNWIQSPSAPVAPSAANGVTLLFYYVHDQTHIYVSGVPSYPS